jgi:FKBP-type peptidyl-prolyl cis-trans isomerase
MKIAAVTVLGIILLAAHAGAETTALVTPKEKISYGMGVDVARNFKKHDVDVDLDLLVKGLKDGLAGTKLLLPEKELRSVLAGFQVEVRQKMAQSRRAAAEENKKKGAAFMAANKGKEGVITLPGGVQYRVVKAGSGRRPTDADSVECLYRGTLLDGTEFDGTTAGNPARLKVSQLIPGWKEAVKLMPEGSKWQIFIPSQLGYGERGVGSDIGPNETLLFEVELLAVK